MRIVSIKTAECRLPLPRPIRLGPVEITTRDFIAVRLATEDGTTGDALGYPRGGPLFEAVDRMAPAILGSDLDHRRGAIDSFLQGHVNSRPAYVKAASLFDIALWDVAAKSVGLPLHRLLGAARAIVPVMVVAGYYLDQRTVEDVCREVGTLCEEGYERIKIMILGTDPAVDERLVKAALAVAGDRLCIDAHWAFRSIPEAYNTLRRLDDLGVRFIEDPFGPYQSNLYPGLQSMMSTPLAAGEDQPDGQSLFELAKVLSVLRVDATTCGGLTVAQAVIEAAAFAGRAILPHVFLPVHAQLAGVHRAIEAVELIPVDSGACPMFDLLEEPPQIRDGLLTIDTSPGSGFRLRWDHVERFAVRSSEHSV